MYEPYCANFESASKLLLEVQDVMMVGVVGRDAVSNLIDLSLSSHYLISSILRLSSQRS